MTDIYSHYSEARDRIHFSITEEADTHKIKCGRCGELLDFAEEAEGCRDPQCPMQDPWIDRDDDLYGPEETK